MTLSSTTGVSPAYAGVEGRRRSMVAGSKRQPRACGGRGMTLGTAQDLDMSAPRMRE